MGRIESQGRSGGRGIAVLCLFGLLTLIAGCQAVQIEAGLKRPAELTATAVAQRPTPTPTPVAPLGWLAFIRGGDLYVQALPDGPAQRLTTDGRTHSPRWSPSGEWLAFQKEPRFLWVGRRAGTDQRPVDLLDPVREPVAWSPTADRLAYISRGGLYLVSAAGDERRELVPPSAREGTGVMALAWSPDGQWIAFERLERQADGRVTLQGLWRVRADGTETREVYRNPDPFQTQSYLAGWSPDGRSLLFWQGWQLSASLLADGAPLMRVPVDGGTPVEIVPRTLVFSDFLAWAPDGQTLAVVEGGGRMTWEAKAITVVRPDGRRQRLSENGRADLFPAWSPDGRWLAVTSGPELPGEAGGERVRQTLAERRIWLIAADGSVRRPLTADARFRDERPQWSRDGQFLLFARLQGEQAQIWLMRADGADQRPVVDELTPSPGWFGSYGHLAWDRLYAWWPAIHVAVPPPTPVRPAVTPSATPTAGPLSPSPTPAPGATGLPPDVSLISRLPVAPPPGDWALAWSDQAPVLAVVAADGLSLLVGPDFVPRRIAIPAPRTPLWAPGGRTLAVVGQKTPDGPEVLWLVETDGTSRHLPLTTGAAVSPNPALVAWLNERELSFTEHCGTACNALWVINTTTGAIRPPLPGQRLPPGTAYAWSPDRQYVAIEDWGPGRPVLRLLDLPRRTVTSLVEESPQPTAFQQFRDWAPDSRAFLYVQWPNRPGPWPPADQVADLRRWLVQAGRAERIGLGAFQGRWSPDGQRLALLVLGTPRLDAQGRLMGSNFQPGQPFAVHLVLGPAPGVPAGSTVIRPVAGPQRFPAPAAAVAWFERRAPRWAPDGAALVYWGEDDLWLVRADGQDARPLTRGLTVEEVAWSSDGRWLALRLPDQVWVVRNPLARD